jgi:hypothetical protein
MLAATAVNGSSRQGSSREPAAPCGGPVVGTGGRVLDMRRIPACALDKGPGPRHEDGRIYIEKINGPMLLGDKATPAKARGWTRLAGTRAGST